MSLHKNCGWWKNSDCIFEFSVKSYVTNTINLSWAKILLPSVIEKFRQISVHIRMEVGKPRWKNSAKFKRTAEGDTVNKSTLVGRIDEIRNLKNSE